MDGSLAPSTWAKIGLSLKKRLTRREANPNHHRCGGQEPKIRRRVVLVSALHVCEEPGCILNGQGYAGWGDSGAAIGGGEEEDSSGAFCVVNEHGGQGLHRAWVQFE